MSEENKSKEFSLKNIDETRNCFADKREQMNFLNNKHKKICTALNYIEHFLILVSAMTGCILISDFASLLGIPIEITNSAVGLKICAVTARIKKHKSIIKTKKKKHVK